MRTSAAILALSATYGINAHMSSVISSGALHTCIIDENKKVKCWGSNVEGQLGDDTDALEQDQPVEMVGVSGDAESVIALSATTCVLQANGRVACTGEGANGELGNGQTEPVRSAGLVSTITGVESVDCSGTHCCAVKSNGGVSCWGAGGQGQCLDETEEPIIDRPVSAKGYVSSGVKQVAAGDGFTCILLNDGKIKCAGGNGNGQLGDGTTEERVALAYVNGKGARPANTGVFAGPDFACLLTKGQVYCWGSNALGQIGDGGKNNVDGEEFNVAPSRYIGVANIAHVVTGSTANAVCTILKNGETKCAGNNEQGQLRSGSAETNNMAEAFDTTIGDVTTHQVEAMALSVQLTCIIVDDKGVYCVGQGDSGSAGEGNDGEFTDLRAISGLYTGAPTTSPTAYPSSAPRGGNDGGETTDPCVPPAGANAKTCKRIVKACRNSDKPMRWTGAGCVRGEGGCRCNNYCGFTCKKFCKGKLNRKVCAWKDGECVLKSTGQVGGNCDA